MPTNQPPPPQGAASSQMLMMMMIFGTMFIMFIPELRDAVGGMTAIVLEPVIGFDGRYPVMTVLLAGIGLVTFSSAVRHYFIDWVDTAEKQYKMKDFNKKLRDARMARNEPEIKRLTQKQLEMSKDQMTSTFDQMKPMVFTMIFLVGTFAFIGAFINNIEGATLSVPWSGNVDMKASISTSTCCAFSNWMLLYMLVSMSVAQVIQRVFKYYSFNKALNDPDSKMWKVKAEPVVVTDAEYDDAIDLEADEEDEFLIVDDEENSKNEAVSGITDAQRAINESIKLDVPHFMEAESSAEVIISVDNKSREALHNLSLDLSDLEGFFKVDGTVSFPVIRPNVKFNKRIRITAKQGMEGEFPVNVTISANGENVERTYTIKVGGTERY